jgi:hypothetical protein
MAVIRLGGFRGEIPRIHPRLLPEGVAQTALNCRMDSGAVESMRTFDDLAPTTLTDPVSLHRYKISDVWLEASVDVDWVPYPVVNDAFGRLIFADPSADELRVTDASLVGTGGYPANYRRLDVPAPVAGFIATLSGTADDTDEVPETRFYVCTFVNNWGAEGPPSPTSNEIEWRSGQTVTLSSLSTVPTGNYNITHRRIYRVNTGSTGVTNFQFVSEVAVASNAVDITAITQANPVVVTTDTPHGLTTGQEIKFTGLGVDVTQDITAITKAGQAQVTVTGHGLASPNVVELTELGSGNGMDELNDTRNTIVFINVDKFELLAVDSTAYVTYVTGGKAAKVFGMDELNNNQYFVAVIDDDNYSLIGLDGSAFEVYVEGGVSTQVAGTSYVDNVPSGSLGEVLPTVLYDPPNDATIGIKAHPAGFLVGFFGKTLAFSEPGAPHAWPIDYRLVTTNDIVAVGVFGNTTAVVTEGWPYIAVGSDPSSISLIELEIEQACASKRGVVDFGSAIAYPSPDGLILLSSNGVSNVTSGVFTRDQWQDLIPSGFVAFNWEQKYLCFYNDVTFRRSFIIDPFAPEEGVKYMTGFALAGYKDINEDLLYLVADVNNDTLTTSRATWDQGTKISYTWKSKPVYTPHAVNMAAAKIIADAYPVTIEFWLDDIKRHTRVVGSLNAFRLPGGFKGEKFEVVLKGVNRVSEVAMATTMGELSVIV